MSWNQRVGHRMQEQAKAMDKAGNDLFRIGLPWMVISVIIFVLLLL